MLVCSRLTRHLLVAVVATVLALFPTAQGRGAGDGSRVHLQQGNTDAARTLPALLAGDAAEVSRFQEWVYGLVLALPPVRDLRVLGWHIDFVDGNCTDLAFDAVTHSAASGPLNIEILDVGLNCSATWNATSPSGERSKGPAILDIGNSNIEFTVVQRQCEDSPCLRAVNVSSNFAVTDVELRGAPLELQLIFTAVKALAIPALEDAVAAAMDGAVDALVDIVGSNVQGKLQQLVDEYAINATAAPPLPLSPDAVDLREDGLVSMMEYITTTVLGNSSAFNVNEVISIVTNGTNAIDLEGLAQNLTVVLSRNDMGTISVALDSVRVSNLNSVNTIHMMQPIAASRVTSRLEFSELALLVRFAYNATLQGPTLNSSQPLLEHGYAETRITPLAGTVDLDFDVSATRLNQLYAESFYKPGCIASAVRAADVSFISTSFTATNTTLMVSDDPHLNTLVSSTLSLAVAPFVDDLPKVFASVYNGPVREGLNEYVQEWLFKSTECSNPAPQYWMPSWVAGGAGLLVFIIVALLLHLQPPKAPASPNTAINTDARDRESSAANSCRADNGVFANGNSSERWARSRHGGSRLRVATKAIARADAAQPHAIDHPATVAEDKMQRVPLLSAGNCGPLQDLYDTRAPCFGNEPAVSTAMRYGLPLMLIFTIVLLVMSQSRVAGSAYFNVHFNGTNFQLPVVKTLLFTRTVQDMWFAHVYVLVGFIVAFSGAWPHIKLVMMLFAWVAPVSWLPVRRRELFLQVLDFLGKWSILDIYVSIMLLVGLHLHVPLYSSDSDGPAYVDLWVETRPAVFYYWTTIMLSLLLTHVMLHVHRVVVHTNAKITPMTAERTALSAHHFYSKGRFLVLTRAGKFFLGSCIAMTLGAIIFGLQTRAFTFRFKGFAAWLIAHAGGSDDRSLSVWGMALNFPESAQHPDSGSTRFVQVVFALFAVALPVSLQLVSAVLWFVPMRPKAHTIVFHITEIIHAWAALEVFVLAIIVALLQLRPLSQFIIGNKCTGINALLRLLFDSELHGDDKCFDVETELDTGSFVLIGCSLFSMLLTLATLALSSHAVKERNGVVTLRKRKAITFILGSSESSRFSRTASYYEPVMRASLSSLPHFATVADRDGATSEEGTQNHMGGATHDDSNNSGHRDSKPGKRSGQGAGRDSKYGALEDSHHGDSDVDDWGNPTGGCCSCSWWRVQCGCGLGRSRGWDGASFEPEDIDPHEEAGYQCDVWAMAQAAGLCQRVVLLPTD